MTRTRAALTLTLMLGFALPAAAQPPDWTHRVPMGKRIFITTHAGEWVEGIAVQIRPDAIVVSTPDGRQAVPYRDVRRAQKRDPAWTGAVTGAAAGVAVGLAVMRNSDCFGRQCTAEETGFIIGSAIYGGLIGWGLDMVIMGKRTIFEASAAPTLTLAPRRGGLSAAVVFSW